MEDAVVSNAYVTLADDIIASDYSLRNLNKSLGEAQVEFAPASKGEENKWGGYKYTSLENIVKAVRPALTKHHLTVSQFPIVDLELKTVSIVSRLVHWDSGEWIQNTLHLPGELALGKDGAPKFNQQTIGGSSTYAQKYAYKTILGIPDSEEMIDSTEEKGDLASRPRRGKQTTEEWASQKSTLVKSAAQDCAVFRSQFLGKAKEHGWGLSDIKSYLKRAYPESSSLGDLTEQQLNDTLRFMAHNKPQAITPQDTQPQGSAA